MWAAENGLYDGRPTTSPVNAMSVIAGWTSTPWNTQNGSENGWARSGTRN